MNQAQIQAKVNHGYAMAALRLGALFTQYRPADPLAPLATPLGTMLADFDIDPKFSYRAPSKYGNPLYYGLFDGTNVLVGDYLTTAQFSGDFSTDFSAGTRTFFVAGYEPNKPMLCVSCNAIISVLEPNDGVPTATSYLGEQNTTYTPLLAGWPASVLDKYRGSKGVVDLPGDVRLPWVEVLLPAYPGITIEMADRITDDRGRVYTVSSTEITDLGWRMTAQLVDT